MTLRRIVRHRVDKDVVGERPLVNLDSVASGGGRLSDAADLVLSQASQNIAAEPGDVLFAKLRPYLRKSLYVEEPVFASGEFLCLRPQPGVVDGRWLLYLSLSDPWVNFSQASSYGAKMPRTSWEEMAALPVSPPPLEVQRILAAFLDDQVARIDEAVRLRREQVDLLDSRLDAALEALLVAPFSSGEALVRLTDPSRPIQYGIVLPGPDVEGGVPIIKGGDVASHRLRLDLLKRTTHEIDAQYSRSRVKAGDLVIAIRGSVGEIGRVPDELTGANLTQDSARIAPLGCDADWLHAVLETPTVQSRMRQMITGATVKGINIGDLRRIEVPTPASLCAQRELGREASRLRSQAFEVRSLCLDSNALLDERKRSLITAAVTGEFDVTTASGRGIQ